MSTFTYYLSVLEDEPAKFKVRIEPDTALPMIREALASSKDLRYSPILPAFLSPDEEPVAPPTTPTSIAFYFANQPYLSLGKIRLAVLDQAERDRVFFTEGLASIVLLNCDYKRAEELQAEINCARMEWWRLSAGTLRFEDVVQVGKLVAPSEGLSFEFERSGDAAIDVYVEQIASSLASLWSCYVTYHPEELETLKQFVKLANELLAKVVALAEGEQTLANLRKRNAIISALVELSASLSYSVTQGTSGSSPILANKSPFPHHSLLGVGGAIRALTKFTRYLEAAFRTRSAAEVIRRQYATKTARIPTKISRYESGDLYAVSAERTDREEFDQGGDFRVENDIPLLTHFSLRHGFKEAKFSVTAASESLTAECLPAWTLMTLSHEIMHSRVRDILHVLFGNNWGDDDPEEQWESITTDFDKWYHSSDRDTAPIDQGIRNSVLNFCLAMDRSAPVAVRRSPSDKKLTKEEVLGAFRRFRRLATELFVHFHDYYFAYACQPKLYVMSLWASWTTVAAPGARPLEYLVRTLVTVASGTGLKPQAAFDYAVEQLKDGLDALEAVEVGSPLFDAIRSFLENHERLHTFSLFKPAYYLIDQIRYYFASPKIATEIDRLETDPFAEGSTVAEDYSASIYVYGSQGDLVSPIRYSLAALVRQLTANSPITDLQWLTAWNALVISSQEAPHDQNRFF